MNASETKYYNILRDGQSYTLRHDLMTPDEEFPLHSHPEWELACVVQGSGTVVMGDEIHPFISGEVTLVPPDMPHGWAFGNSDRDDQNRVEDICVMFRRELFDVLATMMPELQRLGELSRSQTAFRLRGNTLDEVRRLMSAMIGTDEAVRFGMMMRILHILASSDELNPSGRRLPMKKAEEKMMRLNAYIPLHYNRNISIDEMAALVHMNRSSFCVFFRRTTGMSFTECLNAYRIEMACRLLASTDRAVSEIAYGVGFNSAAHFCRTFRKLKGRSPLEYRASGECAHESVADFFDFTPKIHTLQP